MILDGDARSYSRTQISPNPVQAPVCFEWGQVELDIKIDNNECRCL
jgi:hypothetical protein